MRNEVKSGESNCYPRCDDCRHWRNDMCHFASPFLARRETQRSKPSRPKSLNCGIEGKNFAPKDNEELTLRNGAKRNGGSVQ